MTSARHRRGGRDGHPSNFCDLVQEPHHLVHEPHHRPVRRVTGRSRYRASPGPEDAFAGAAGYLNTASIGIPPRVALEDLRAAVDVWARGRRRRAGVRRARRAGTGGVRAPARRRPGDGRGRAAGLLLRRHRRGLAAARRGGGRVRRRLHLGAVPVPGAQRPARAARRGPRRRARRAATLDRPGRRQRGPVGRRPGRRPRGAARGGRPLRRAHADRRHAGQRLAAARRRRLRLRDRRRVQVAAVPARQRVHDRSARTRWSGCSRPPPDGSRASRAGTRCTAGRCGSPPTRGGWTSHPPG